jgi:hypothetical protein
MFWVREKLGRNSNGSQSLLRVLPRLRWRHRDAFSQLTMPILWRDARQPAGDYGLG